MFALNCRLKPQWKTTPSQPLSRAKLVPLDQKHAMGSTGLVTSQGPHRFAASGEKAKPGLSGSLCLVSKRCHCAEVRTGLDGSILVSGVTHKLWWRILLREDIRLTSGEAVLCGILLLFRFPLERRERWVTPCLPRCENDLEYPSQLKKCGILRCPSQKSRCPIIVRPGRVRLLSTECQLSAPDLRSLWLQSH